MSNGRLGLRTRPGLIRAYTQGINVPDADADAFILATGITDQTQINAISQLVADLKGYGIWSKMKAIYPFVGGTADTHKWNLKDPRDFDSAFRLVFTGGWTHSSTGALPNGTNGYADTKLNPNTISMNKDSVNISYYRRTTNANSYVLMGCISGSSPNIVRLNLAPNYNSSFNNISEIISTATQQSSSAILTLGLISGNRVDSTQFKMYSNGIVIQTVTRNSLTQVNANIVIGATNYDLVGFGVTDFTNNQCAFASIGDGLTDTEAGDLYTAVQAFQTTLGRQV